MHLDFPSLFYVLVSRSSIHDSFLHNSIVPTRTSKYLLTVGLSSW